MRSHTLYLSDLAAALEKIEEFTAGMTYDQFLHDDRTQSAVIRKFEIIGEAAKKDSAARPGEVSRRSLARDGGDAG
jgi:uncharacterized protein with HEPN domain